MNIKIVCIFSCLFFSRSSVSGRPQLFTLSSTRTPGPVPVQQRIGYDSPIVPAVNQKSDHHCSSDHASVSSKALVEDMIVDQPVEDEPMTAVHSDLDSAAAQTEDSDSFHTPRGSSEEENEAVKNDQEVQKNKLRQQRLENLFSMKVSMHAVHKIKVK